MKIQVVGRFVALLTMASGALMAQNAPAMATPGTVNYIEGNVSVNGAALDSKQIGRAALQANQVIATGDGKAEVLLSPGIFLRVGSNSQVRMVSPELVDPRIEVVRGIAMVEVDAKIKEARADVLQRGATASLLKQGLYRFDGDQGRIQVIDGKLRVTANGQSKELGKGKEIVLDNSPQLKAVSFDRNAKDDLYVWSDIRSNYLAEANASTAQYIYGGYGPYRGDGWYWNPSFAMYSWLPGDGFFYSPFGYPFYSLGYIPYYRGWGGGNHWHRPLTGHLPPRTVVPVRPGGGSVPHSVPHNGFRGGTGGFHGGGFHGGGGGFHGGGGHR